MLSLSHNKSDGRLGPRAGDWAANQAAARSRSVGSWFLPCLTSLSSAVERVMDSNCLLATLYRKFGIDTSFAYHDNSVRPIPILTDGEPIAELL